MRTTWVLLAPVCLLLLACPGPGDTSGPDSGSEAGQSVTVSQLDRYFTGPSEVTSVPTDGGVEVLVLEGDTYVARTGTQVDAGTWRFDDVATGPSVIRAGTRYVFTSAREVDLGAQRLGRPDVAHLTRTTTPALLELTGLAPWEMYDQLLLSSAAVELWGVLKLQPTPNLGTTSLTTDRVTYSSRYGQLPVLEADKGDDVWLTQWQVQDAGTPLNDTPVDVRTITRAAHLESLSFDGGTPLQLTGTLQEVPQKSLTFDWRRDTFWELALSVSPDAQRSGQYLSVSPAAYGLEAGWVGYTGDVLTVWVSSILEGELARTLSYGNPYPDSWDEVMVVDHDFIVQHTPPGSSSTVDMLGSISVTDTVAGLTAGPIVARLSPARSVTIDGESAFTSRAVGSASPVVAWEAPAVGTPTAYELRVYELVAASVAGTQPALVATLTMPARQHQVRIPAGILGSGKHYALKLTAFAAPGVDVERTPLLRVDAVPQASADVLSGMLSVP